MPAEQPGRWRILLAPVGSSGDVHPYIGLGRELVRRGHEVRLFASEPFRALAEQVGLHFVPTWSAEAYEAAVLDPDLWHPRRGLRFLLRVGRQTLPSVYTLLDSSLLEGRTVVVGHTLSWAARVLEEKTGVPALTIHLAPSAFRSEHQQPAIAPGRDLSSWPRWGKRTFWWLADRLLIDPHFLPWFNRWRRTLGLPPVGRLFKDWIHSPQGVVGFFPEWYGAPQPDWPRPLVLAGFPLFDEPGGAPEDRELEDFLASREPPVVFTPGSANRHAGPFFEVALGALQRLARRGLFLTRYPEQLPPTPKDVLVRRWVPLGRVLGRGAALVHHGGIGTSAQGLAAGIPQLIRPLAYDQPDNALRLERLGVGTYLTARRFTARRLAAALDRLLHSERVGTRCRQLAERIRPGEGLARAAAAVEAAGSGQVAELTRTPPPEPPGLWDVTGGGGGAPR